MPIPLMMRNNDIDSEHAIEDYSGIRKSLARTPVRSAFKDGLPANYVEALLSQLPKMTVHKTSGPVTGVSLFDQLMGSWSHANPVTNTAYVNNKTALEELTHLLDFSADVPLTKRPEFRDAVERGAKRMSDAYIRPVWGGRRGVSSKPEIPNNKRMAQLLSEMPGTPHSKTSSTFGPHGSLYEKANKVLDFPNFDDRAAASVEALPAIMELPRDTAEKYYPEALKLINDFIDEFPKYDGEAKYYNMKVPTRGE